MRLGKVMRPAKLLIAIAASFSIASGFHFASAFCSSDFAADSDYPYKYFQTKTLYDTVRGEISIKDRPADCSPVAIIMLVRHGSRHPGTDEADIFQSLQDLASIVNETEKATMCKEDLQKIESWKNWHQPDLDKDLAITGYNEQVGLAQRYSRTFPELFSDATVYRFLASDRQRTTQSAQAFMDGYLAEAEPRPEVEINNKLIIFYEFCKKYIVEVDDNDDIMQDVKNFENGEDIAQISHEFAERIGVPQNEITIDLTENARKQGCAEEEWATGSNSSWCLAFTKEDLQAFEYGEDMDDYLAKSFGIEISYRQSCQLKHFMLSALKNASLSGGNKMSTFLFGHSKTLMSLLTEMKLIEDDGPFTSADYPEKVDRKFRASLYTPGSGNVAFILYRCGDANELKLQIFHNEKLLRMPLDAPSVDGLWNFDEALQYFGFYNPQDCMWDEMCATEEKTTDSPVESTTSDARILSEEAVLFRYLSLVLCLVIAAMADS